MLDAPPISLFRGFSDRENSVRLAYSLGLSAYIPHCPSSGGASSDPANDPSIEHIKAQARST